MHKENIELWQHHHTFNTDKQAVEKRTLIVVIITFAMMIGEILFGWLSNSMALLADGWHMGTHAFAMSISLFAYIFARKFAADRRYSFGTWKMEILGAYSSAIVLALVGVYMVFSSIERIVHPQTILYNQALAVAIVGLLVNTACAMILDLKPEAHRHDHDHHHDHAHHHDLNLQSAYLHVVADALTSVLAIAALIGAKYFQFDVLDPLMGIVGAGLILHWSVSLLKETAGILLEREKATDVVQEIREHLEADGDTKVSDLHLLHVAQHKYACVVSLVTGTNCTTDEYKLRLQPVHELGHITIEINRCSYDA
jgi:cation diffusion facilitator family transporter